MSRSKLILLIAFLAALVAADAPAGGAAPAKRQVRIWTIHYRAHDGAPRKAYVLLPSWYRPSKAPAIPLIISPHGRGVTARANLALWGALPARGSFAVVSPDGEGRRLPLYSWGSAGQINDLAKMPKILRLTLPWVHVDQRRIYAFGGSMGGQETLLLLAQHPGLLAGAAAFDSVTDLARQYRSFPDLTCNKRCLKTWNGPIGVSLQDLARTEIGGTPKTKATVFAKRSPLTYARRIALSCVPLQLWWSLADRIVFNQQQQSGALYKAIQRYNRRAPVKAFVGFWAHSAEMHAKSRLPVALIAFGLLPPLPSQQVRTLTIVEQPAISTPCTRRR